MTARPRAVKSRHGVVISHLAGVMAGAGATMLGPMLPVLSRIWSLSDAEAGMLLACEFIGGFCGAMGCGWLARRKTPMTLLTTGILLLAVGYGGAYLMVRRWVPLCLFVCGLGLGFVNPTANVIVSRAGFQSPAAALNLFGFSWAAGALAAPSVIALLLLHQPPSHVFLELAIVTAALAAFGVIGKPAIEEIAAESETPAAGERTGWFIAITGALLFLYVGVETSVSVWLPTGASRWAAMTAPEGAAAQSAFWGALLLGRLLAPVCLRRISPRALILIGLAGAAAGAGMLVFSSVRWSVAPGAILAGLGLAPVNPTIVAVFTTRLGSAAARWAGPVFAAAGLGGAVIPWSVGVLSAHFSNLQTGLAVALVCILAMFCLVPELEKRQS